MRSSEQEYRFDANSLRDPAELMQTERLISLKQTRLSFARLLMKRMVDEQWSIELSRAEVDENGVGRFVYHIDTPSQLLSFGVFSHDPEGENTDRIIATNWDMWGFLTEGEIPQETMDAQAEELPHVREGRATPDTLIWTRSNRSGRFFGHVVDSLVEGHQPDVEFLSRGGYLMRSSGYYGNGYNGTKEYRALSTDHPVNGPYMAQMLSVYMLRIFSYDLADHIAKERNPDAATLDEDIKRYMGTGNSSGVGIIHYNINHPKLLNAWIRAREIALSRTKTIEPSDEEISRFRTLLDKAEHWFAEDESETKDYFLSKDRIAEGLGRIREQLDAFEDEPADEPLWNRLCEWTEEHMEMEIQEVLHSLIIDVHPEVCEGLEDALTVSEKDDLQPEMALAQLRSIINSSYQWALDIDMSKPNARRYFWYRSIDSEEPRIGIRGKHDYEEYEFPIDIANQVQELTVDLSRWDGRDTVAEFLLEHPEHRGIVRRIQMVHDLPYAEIRTNPLDGDFVPLSFISCIKALWGIQRAHPKSQGWVRGTFYQGAPLPKDIERGEDTYWLYPKKPERASQWRDS